MVQSTLSSIGLVVGFGTLLHLVYKTVKSYNLYFRVPAEPLKDYRLNASPTNGGSIDKPVAWALITGSSGGIGFGYAQYLLSLGFGVIILAREGITEAESRLRKAHPKGNIMSFNFDCTTTSAADIEELVRQVEVLPITILINNVGSIPMEAPQFRQFRDYDAQGIDNHFNLNSRFMTHLTRLMMPVLTRNAQPRALILNVTSAGRVGIPWLSMYSATKGYVTTFSHVLTRECKTFNYPIDCLLIVPGDVHSSGNTRGLSKGSPLAGDYAKMVLDRVDAAVGQGLLEISPFWKHALEIAALNWIPELALSSELTRIIVAKKEAWEKDE